MNRSPKAKLSVDRKGETDLFSREIIGTSTKHLTRYHHENSAEQIELWLEPITPRIITFAVYHYSVYQLFRSIPSYASPCPVQSYLIKQRRSKGKKYTNPNSRKCTVSPSVIQTHPCFGLASHGTSISPITPYVLPYLIKYHQSSHSAGPEARPVAVQGRP